MIITGICSWTEQTLVRSGDFYPPGINSSEDRLKYYAGRFSTVEADAPYYAIPAPRIASLWAQRTPADFIFHIKAFGALTGHPINPAALPAELKTALPEELRNRRSVRVEDEGLLLRIIVHFKAFIEPLRSSGKLGVILFQYPPWFRYSSANVQVISDTAHWFEGYTVAVEFRHGSWLAGSRRGQVLGFLHEHGLVYVTADEPQYGSQATVPFVPAATTPIAYIRLHGRNKNTWLKKGIATSLRYDYLYDGAELRSFVPALRDLESKTKKTFVMFNNCHGSKAVRNACSLNDILTQ